MTLNGARVLTVCSLLLIPFMGGRVFAQVTAATLTVEVTNGTADGAPVAGDEVTVQLFQHNELLNSLQSKVGEDGKAVFDEVPTGDHVVALARVRHHDMMFRGAPVVLSPTGRSFSARVQVFDVSSDTSPLSVGTHHLMVAVRSTSLEFTEYMQLRNPSDTAITGSKRDAQNRPIVLDVVLPRGFKSLTSSSYLEQTALVATETGFYDTLAVPPGEHQVTFSYQLDIDRGTMEVAKKLSLPTSELEIFWEAGRGRLEGLGEPDDRLSRADGVPVEYYRRSNLEAGDEIAFRISGFNVKQSENGTWVILIVVFAAILAVAVMRLRPKSARSEQ